MSLKVAEKFISVNGEGLLAGQLAVFIRFAGCNLDCSYCDTKWANEKHVPYEKMSAEEIYHYIKETKVKNITLTGGEPLLQKEINELLEKISADKALRAEIETNGSVLLKQFAANGNPPSFTMDYKLPSSGMEHKMLLQNFEFLTKKDTLKFVCGTQQDLDKVKDIISKYGLVEKTNVFISPVFGQIEGAAIADFMRENQLNGVTLQIQLHKVIWNADKRGV